MVLPADLSDVLDGTWPSSGESVDAQTVTVRAGSTRRWEEVFWRWETLRPEDGGDDWTNSMVRDPTETWDVRVFVVL
jgi:hypothetical protein